MRFPKREPDIARLAHDLVNGLRANAEDFPSPPVSPDQLQQTLDRYDAAREAAITRYAHAVSGTQEKDEALDALIDEMRPTIRYAENTVKGDDGKLQLIGWGRRRTPSPTDLPGQVRTLELIHEGENWVELDWKQPSGGGMVTAYKIHRRKRDGGSWMDAGMAVETEALLAHQESGIECEYRVLAVNKLGEGPPSNIVRAVL
jgi:Fibronectin type III domain